MHSGHQEFTDSLLKGRARQENLKIYDSVRIDRTR